MHADTLKRVKKNGFTVVIYTWCGSWVNVRYCGLDGMRIKREKFWIHESELKEF